MYKEITEFNSPNYTEGYSASRSFGYPRAISHIVIHHWGDPGTNPTFDGVVSWLCNPSSGVSAHAVAEAGRVAFLVNLDRVAWAAGHSLGNAQGIQIECNPRMSMGDFETVCELVADYREHHGDLLITSHDYWVNTQCPGKWNVYEIDARAYEIGIAKYGRRHG